MAQYSKEQLLNAVREREPALANASDGDVLAAIGREWPALLRHVVPAIEVPRSNPSLLTHKDYGIQRQSKSQPTRIQTSPVGVVEQRPTISPISSDIGSFLSQPIRQAEVTRPMPWLPAPSGMETRGPVETMPMQVGSQLDARPQSNYMINQEGLLTDEPMYAQLQNVPQLPFQPPQEMPQDAGSLQRPKFGPPAPAPGPPKIPKDPDSRMDLYRNLLGDFVWSLASGAEAGSKAAPGQRNRAAFAGALKGPYYRQKAKQDLELSEARQAQTQAAADKAMAAIGVEKLRADNAAQAVIDLKDRFNQLAGIRDAEQKLKEEQAKLAAAKTQTEIDSRQAKIDALEAQANRPISFTGGLWSPKTNELIPGTEPTNTVMITPELATEAGLPPQLIGKTVKISELTPYLKPETAIATTEDAVQLIDKRDGKTIKVIGKPKPTAAPQGQIVDIEDPTNPDRTQKARISPDNSVTPIEGTGKTLPAVQAEGRKLETVARDASTQFGILQDLIKQKNSTADQDIVVRYFDIVMPVVGRRMSKTELDRLASVGDVNERAKILLQQFGSREIFTEEVRKEILNAAKANVDGKQKAVTDWQQEHRPKPNSKSLADEIRSRIRK